MTTGADDFASVRFSTADLPERERIPVVREVFSRTLLQVDIDALSDTQPHIDMTMRAMSGLRTGLCANSAWRVRRTPEMIAKGDDDMALVISVGVPFMMSLIGREVTVEAGSAVLVPNADPAMFTQRESGGHLSVIVPRAALAPLVSDIEDAAARAIPRDSEALKLLVGYLRSILEDVTLAAPELRRLAVTHVHDLFALAIGATREASDLAQMRGVRAARVREIISQIKSDFAEPSCSPNTVAAKLRLSPRYVQDLLQDTGENFTERVLEMRLQKARRMLMLSENDRLTVGDVAYACGFNEVSYFNRCFRRRFGAPPSHLRGKGADS